MEKRELKKSLEELRNLINANNMTVEHYKETNCYAYALGLDVKEEDIAEYAYQPGMISGVNKLTFDRFTYEELLYWLSEDFKVLNIDYMDSNPEELMREDEWKIAIFTEYDYSNQKQDYLDDYHFLRQSKNGIWYHKIGWESFPTNKDSNYKVIKDVSNCYIAHYDFKKCLKLKLK